MACALVCLRSVLAFEIDWLIECYLCGRRMLPVSGAARHVAPRHHRDMTGAAGEFRPTSLVDGVQLGWFSGCCSSSTHLLTSTSCYPVLPPPLCVRMLLHPGLFF